jgi:hypothetical protein
MIDDETRPEARRRVTAEAALRDASPAPAKAPRKLPLKVVHVEERVFQQRGVELAIFSDSQRHIDSLAAILKANSKAELEPLTVWWSGERWIVVDGHHRLKSYQQVHNDPKVRRAVKAVPVEAFNGTLKQAILRSAEGNTKDKLPMSKDEKSDFAWRMVCETPAAGEAEIYSKAELAASAGISERTIANMRRVRKDLERKDALSELDDEMPAEGLGELSWMEALCLSRGETVAKDGLEWLDAEAARWAKKIAEALGSKPYESPGLMARALLKLSEKMVADMLQEGVWFDIQNEIKREQEDDLEIERLMAEEGMTAQKASFEIYYGIGNEVDDDGLSLDQNAGDF